MEYSSGSDSKLSKGNISLDKRFRIDSSDVSDDSPNRVTKRHKSNLNENFNRNDLELSGEESELELNKNKKSPPKSHTNSRPKRTVKSRPSKRTQESDDSEILEDRSDSDFEVDHVSKAKRTNLGPIRKKNIRSKASKKSSKQLNKDNSDSSGNESLPGLKEKNSKDKESGNSEGETLENARNMFSHSKPQKNPNNVSSIKNKGGNDNSSDSDGDLSQYSIKAFTNRIDSNFELSDDTVESNKLVREEEQMMINNESSHGVEAKILNICEKLSDDKDILTLADSSTNKPDKTGKNQPNKLDSNSILKYLKSTDSDSAEEGSNKLGLGDSTEDKDSDTERLTQAQNDVKKMQQNKAKHHSELEDDSDEEVVLKKQKAHSEFEDDSYEELASKKQNSLKKTQQKKEKADSELEYDSDEEVAHKKQNRVKKTQQKTVKAHSRLEDDSDEELAPKKQNGLKKTQQKRAKPHSELEDDSDEELAPKKQNGLKKTQQKRAKPHSELEDDSDEELAPKKQNSIKKSQQKTTTKASKLNQGKTKKSSAKPQMARSSSMSDEGNGTGGHNSRKMKSHSPQSSDEVVRVTEGTHDISPSGSDEEETLALKPKRTETKKRTVSTSEKKMKSLDSEEGSSSDDEKESSTKKIQDTSNKNPHKEPGVIRHKRYLAAAGLRVQNYSKLWENCNSNKARVAAMLALLTKNGLSGRPTIDKCVKLRKRRETKQEIQELDLDNILQSGRGGRRTRGAAQSPPERTTFEPSDESAEEDKKHRFARIKALADSDSD